MVGPTLDARREETERGSRRAGCEERETESAEFLIWRTVKRRPSPTSSESNGTIMRNLSFDMKQHAKVPGLSVCMLGSLVLGGGLESEKWEKKLNFVYQFASEGFGYLSIVINIVERSKSHLHVSEVLSRR